MGGYLTGMGQLRSPDELVEDSGFKRKLAHFKVEAKKSQREILFVVEDLKTQSLQLVIADGDNLKIAYRAGMKSFDLQVLNAGEFQSCFSGTIVS